MERWNQALQYLQRANTVYENDLYPSQNNRRQLMIRIDNLTIRLYDKLSMYDKIK
jgi:hypothetical protein